MRQRIPDETVMNAAIRCFGEYGYKKATLDDIASELGISGSSMYAYAASKRELYEQCVRFVMQRWQNKVKASVALETDAKSKLNVLFSTALNYLSGDAAFCSLLKKDPSIFPMFPSEDPYSDINERSVGMIEDILREGISSGAFRDLSVRPAAEVIFSMYKGFIIQAYVNGEEKYLEKYTASAVELLTCGIYR